MSGRMDLFGMIRYSLVQLPLFEDIGVLRDSSLEGIRIANEHRPNARRHNNYNLFCNYEPQSQLNLPFER